MKTAAPCYCHEAREVGAADPGVIPGTSPRVPRALSFNRDDGDTTMGEAQNRRMQKYARAERQRLEELIGALRQVNPECPTALTQQAANAIEASMTDRSEVKGHADELLETGLSHTGNPAIRWKGNCGRRYWMSGSATLEHDMSIRMYTLNKTGQESLCATMVMPGPMLKWWYEMHVATADKAAWTDRWRLHDIRNALFASSTQGDHRLVSGVCLCGHKVDDELKACSVEWT